MFIDYIKDRKRNNLIVSTYLKVIGLIFIENPFRS